MFKALARVASFVFGPFVQTEPESLTFSIDYSRAPKRLLALLEDTPFTLNQTDVGIGVVHFEAKLFQFQEGTPLEFMESSILFDDMVNPWAPARVEHLWAFGQKYLEMWHYGPDSGRGQKLRLLSVGSKARNRQDDVVVPMLGQTDCGGMSLMTIIYTVHGSNIASEPRNRVLAIRVLPETRQ